MKINRGKQLVLTTDLYTLMHRHTYTPHTECAALHRVMEYVFIIDESWVQIHNTPRQTDEYSPLASETKQFAAAYLLS